MPLGQELERIMTPLKSSDLVDQIPQQGITPIRTPRVTQDTVRDQTPDKSQRKPKRKKVDEDYTEYGVEDDAMVGINKQLLDYANAVEKLPKKKPKRKKGHASPDVTRHDSGVPMEAVTPDSAFGHPLTDQNTTKALVNALKHLAGRHDQLDHGKRGGKGHWSTAAVNVINTIDRGGSIRHFSTTTLQHALDIKKDLLAGYYGPYSAPHNKATVAGKKKAQGHVDAIEAELKRRSGNVVGKFKKGDVVETTGTLRVRVVGKRGNYLVVRPVGARPGSFADADQLISPEFIAKIVKQPEPGGKASK